MSKKYDQAVRARLAELRREMDTLTGKLVPVITSQGEAEIQKMREEAHRASDSDAKSPLDATRKTQHRISRVVIASGIALTTRPGSIYATISRTLASLGHLDRQDHLFKKFLKSKSRNAARELFAEIGVTRHELEEFARADDDFIEHCQTRTAEYKNKSARGSKKHAAILKDPRICDEHGNWQGNFDEAISILSGARSLKQVRHGKNLQILNRAKLMFDTATIDGAQRCFLYKQCWHRAFRQALALCNA